MSDELQRLQEKESRAKRYFEYSKLAFLMYFFAVTIFFIFQFIQLNGQIAATLQQVRDSQIANQASGKDNHARTQAYIRCIGEALLVPLAQRDQIDFDSCTVTADDNSNGTNKPAAAPQTTQAVTNPVPVTSEPTTAAPTTSAPPDPERPRKLIDISLEPLIRLDSVIDRLGL